MSLDRANEILRNYNQCYEQFDTLHKSLSRILPARCWRKK